MKQISILFMLASTLIACRSSKEFVDETVSAPAVTLNSVVDSFFYAVGVNFGAGMREQLKSTENYDALIAGLTTAINDRASQLMMTREEAYEYIQKVALDAEMKEAEITKAEGDAFMAANKTREGVITTESGLQYKVLTEGTGERPTLNDMVIVQYTCKLLDGTVIDSSENRGEPQIFGLTNVIPGWREGLHLMPAGSKYIFWIPSELAYGDKDMQGIIKLNSTLEFEVELLGIKKDEYPDVEEENPEESGMMDYGSPNVKQELVNDQMFVIREFATDTTYGYTQENPVMVGGADNEGPLNERRFLNALSGPKAEQISYQRLGSCCLFNTKNITPRYAVNYGALDMYEITYEGLETPIILYINMYDSDTLKVPVGFMLKLPSDLEEMIRRRINNQ